jgi:MFS family permease
MDKTKSIIRVFIAITFLYWISLYLYVPTLPSYVNSQTVSLAAVGLVLSMYGLWQLILRIPFGVLVDVTGRRKILISLGLLCSAVGAILMARGETVFVIGVGRAFTGLAAATWVPLIAVFSSFFHAEKAVFATSLLTFCASFGRMLSTLSNGFLNGIGGYSLAFYCAAGAAVLSIVILLFSKIERHTTNKFSLRSVGVLLFRKEFLFPTLLSVVIMYGTWAITYSFLPIRAHNLGANDIEKSILLALSIGALTAGNLVNTAISKWKRHSYMLYAGILLFASGITAASFSPTLWLLYLCAGIIGLANGVNYPTLMGLSITYVEQKERNTAMGMHQSIYAIGMFTGPWLSGIIADHVGIPTMFLVTAGFVLIGGISLTYLLIGHQKTVDTSVER